MPRLLWLLVVSACTVKLLLAAKLLLQLCVM
jgi:hypothetical protein